MSIFAETDQQQAKELALGQIAEAKPTGFMENAAAAWKEFNTNEALGALDSRRRTAFDDRIAKAERMTGRKLDNPLPIQKNRIGLEDPISLVYNMFADDDGAAEIKRMNDHEAQIDELRQQLRPEDRAELPTRQQILEQLQSESKQAEKEAKDIGSRATIPGVVGGIAGGSAASITQPEMLMTLPIGAPVRMGLLARMLTETAIGAGSQAVFEPTVQQQRSDLGLESGIGQAAENIGMAGLGAGVLTGAIGGAGKLLGVVMRGGVPAFEKAAGRAATADERALIDSVQHDTVMEATTPYVEKDAATYAVKQQNENVAYEAAIQAQTLNPSELRTLTGAGLNEPPPQPGMIRVYHSGVGGEGETGRWVSTSRQYASDYRGDLPLYYMDLPETDPRVNNPDIPEQGVKQGFTFAFETTPEEAVRLREVNRSPIAETKAMLQMPPAGLSVLRNADLDRIGVNAELMQFKAGGDTEGLTERLRGITEWQTERAGVSLLYEFEDGSTIIADGHQRLGLARRLASEGKEVELPAITLRAADGITPEMARARAAFKNIAEGTGTAQDAAKVLRDLGASPADMGLPPKSALVRDAEGLTNLDDSVFGMVVNDVLSEQFGAIVGRLVRDPQLQPSIAGLLVKLKPANAVEADSIVRQALDAGSTREMQTSLFGDEQIAESLYLERARVLDRGLKMLRRNIDTFRTLTERGEDITGAGNVLDQNANTSRLDIERALQQYIAAQAHRKGTIGDELTKAARDAKETGRYADAARGFVQAITDATQRGEIDGRAVSATRVDVEPQYQVGEKPNFVEASTAQQVDDATLDMFGDPVGPAIETQSLRLANEVQQDALDRAGVAPKINVIKNEDGTIDYIPEGLEKGGLNVMEFGNAFRVGMAFLPKEMRGQGVAVSLYEKAIKDAVSAGKGFVSDGEVSAAARKVYTSLERKGYKFDVSDIAATQEDGTLRNPGGDGAVYTLRSTPPETTPQKLLGGAPPQNDADALLLASTRAPDVSSIDLGDDDLLNFAVPIGERIEADGTRVSQTQSIRDMLADLEEDQNFAEELGYCGMNGKAAAE